MRSIALSTVPLLLTVCGFGCTGTISGDDPALAREVDGRGGQHADQGSCGNGQCNGKESCASCPSDCGACPVDASAAPADAGSAPTPDTTSAPTPDAGSAISPDTNGPPPVGSIDECANAPADWVFCSGFEEGDFSIWDDYDGNPSSTNRLVEDSGPFGLSGNHVAQLMPPEGRGGADLVKVLSQKYDKLYARWFVKWEPGFDFNARGHGGGLFAGDRSKLGQSDYRPSDWFGSYVDYKQGDANLFLYSYYPGMYQDCADPNGACWGDAFPCVYGSNYCTDPDHLPSGPLPQMQTDRWYCVELAVDGGTPTSSASGASGSLNLSIDGQSIGPWTGLWLRSSADVKLSILWINQFHHESHPLVGVRYDNVVVSKSPIGCPTLH